MCKLTLASSVLCTKYKTASSTADAVATIGKFVDAVNNEAASSDGDWYFSWITGSCTQANGGSSLIFATSVANVSI